MAHERPAEEMRPGEIIAARQEAGCAFVPVSPAFEWHSFHLPVGTDALVAEGVCRAVAARVGGIWFRPLSCGLDAWRSEDELLQWGLEGAGKVFGMRFPGLPVCSEYCEEEGLRRAVGNRLLAVRESGFRHAFLVNHHGGRGQVATLEGIAAEHGTDSFGVQAVTTHQFNDLDAESLRVGGHAGLSETTWVLAFRPELVDLSRQEDGPLVVRETGILHRVPVIESEHNPRNASVALAHELRERVVANFEAHVRRITTAP